MSDLQSNIIHLRKDYTQASLNESEVQKDPMQQFAIWMEQALKAEIAEPNAMNLSTVNAAGEPSGRIVLLRGFDTRGFPFFTNYNSQKGQEVAQNPRAALTFFWPELERQIRISGTVAKTSAAESDQYYQSRPRGSRLGAWASPQSEVLPDRSALEALLSSVEEKFTEESVPRPASWGGYILQPVSIEFWQGRASRLHDRLRYRKSGEAWVLERLAP